MSVHEEHKPNDDEGVVLSVRRREAGHRRGLDPRIGGQINFNLNID